MPTKVVILAGQSNAAGWPTYATLPASVVHPVPSVEIYAEGTVDAGLASAWNALDVGYGQTITDFGPEISLANQLKTDDPATTWRIIKAGYASTKLATDWDPATGATYAAFIAEVQTAMALIPGVSLAGMVWIQGESDGYAQADAIAYPARLLAFVARVRADLAVPTLPVVVAPLASDHPFAWGRYIREGQLAAQFAASDVTVISTDGLAREQYLVHYDVSGVVELGKRCAAALNFAGGGRRMAQIGRPIPRARRCSRQMAATHGITGAALAATGSGPVSIWFRANISRTQTAANAYVFVQGPNAAGQRWYATIASATGIMTVMLVSVASVTADLTPYMGRTVEFQIIHGNGNTPLEVWADGVLIASSAPCVANIGASAFLIGDPGGGNGTVWNVGDLRVLNRQMTPDEIIAGRQGLPVSAANLLRQWPLDDPSGTTVRELVGATNDVATSANPIEEGA